jgi:hypothetical protein
MRHLIRRLRRGGDSASPPGPRRRWLDRRLVLALVAAVAVVATAAYATGAHGSAPIRAHQAADTGAVGSGISDPSSGTDPLTLPFTLTDLHQKVDLYTPTGITGPTSLLQPTSQLIGTYQLGVSTDQIQPFLDQAATATTTQQISDDANTFLLGQGVDQATIDKALADIDSLRLQKSVSMPGQGSGVGDVLAELLKWLGLAAAIILAAVLAYLASKGILGSGAGSGAATTNPDSKVQCKASTGTWQGPPLSTDAGRDAALALLPRRTTAGFGVDSDGNEYVFNNVTTGPDPGQWTFDSSRDDPEVVAATNARLQQHNINITSGDAHAEQKMATFMRICHINSLDFVINNTYVCTIPPNACNTVLPFLLGTGQELNVSYEISRRPLVPITGPGPLPVMWEMKPYVGV